MPHDRLHTYAASLAASWLDDRLRDGDDADGGPGAAATLERVVDGEPPVFVSSSPAGTAAIAVAQLWDASADAAAEEARFEMEERLSAGSVRGPFIIWVPPRGSVPRTEPEASDFVMRAQLAAASLQPGARSEIDLPVNIQLAKVRDEGGYASVIGGLSRFWTNITDRVEGTVHVNSMSIRRLTTAEGAREALYQRIGEISKTLNLRDAVDVATVESWTVQRLASDPLGERGFAIAQSPPKIDPADGTLMRRLVRSRLKAAAEALASVEAAVKGVALIAIYEYAEHENAGSFVKSLDPGLYAGLGFVAAVVDGEVRPILAPRR